MVVTINAEGHRGPRRGLQGAVVVKGREGRGYR